MNISREDSNFVLPLNQLHLNEVCEKRKLEQSWVLANCKSISKREASQLLGYPSKSDGIWMQGIGLQGQFKPDAPWSTRQDKKDSKKPPKYRSPQDDGGEYDAILVNAPGEPNYWLDLEPLKFKAWKMQGHPCILITEGVFKAIAGCSHNIPTVALLGVEMGLTSGKLDPQGKRYLVQSLEKLARAGFGFIFAFDADCSTNGNVRWAQRKLGHQLKNFDVPCWSITGSWQVDPQFENQNKGMDDFIANFGIEKFRSEVLRKAISFEDWQGKVFEANELLTEKIIEVEELYTQKAQSALYEGYWIAIEDSLYKWVGSHYQKQGKESERRRIAKWCTSTPVEVSKGQWKYAYATSTHVSNIWNWVLEEFGVGKAEINPPGINCLNGVVRIYWEGPIAKWQLEPHKPDRIYTYVSEIEFNPDLDPSECDRLLSCLSPDQQQVLIKTLAAGLDLAKVRGYQSRLKALLLQGYGNNGKDSLREAVRLLLGNNLVSASLSDFAAYDAGRKFPLSKLDGAWVSWSSENTSFSQIDKIQCIKEAISGETLYAEQKGENERPMLLNTVFLFNVNDAPNLKAGLEAILSRWAVLKFVKTFKRNANPERGEIEADSRFRYDPQFMRAKVVPALLNKMLESLSNLCVEGINYECLDGDLEDMQRETNHLWAFAQDVGLGYQEGGKIYISDLWDTLKSWYINNGTLVITTSDRGKEKLEWYDQARISDKNVKGANQVYPRFKELLPKIEKGVETIDRERRGQGYLSGIGFIASPASHPPTEGDTASLEYSAASIFGEAETTLYQRCEASEASEAVFRGDDDDLRSQEEYLEDPEEYLDEPEEPEFAIGDQVSVLTGMNHPHNVVCGTVVAVKGSNVFVQPNSKGSLLSHKRALMTDAEKALYQLRWWPAADCRIESKYPHQ